MIHPFAPPLLRERTSCWRRLRWLVNFRSAARMRRRSSRSSCIAATAWPCSAMNWKKGKPPQGLRRLRDRVQGARRRPLLRAEESHQRSRAPTARSTRSGCRPLSPIQKFRWVHFPRNAELAGEFVYRVTPGLHERRRRAELRRAAGGRHRASARDLSRPAQRHLHPRLRVVAGLRRSLRQVGADLRRCSRRRRTTAWSSCRRIPRPTRRWPGWASRRARPSSRCSTRPSRTRPRSASSPTT